ncbi:hypothetical protein [Halobacillus salinus]|uniref:hypothetical protein n=1 Tax=Halobacillus salinus TaxID=192814 RepID=UPI0009A887F4|nr:hypothetical protein [Halobacillus salinus]
MLKGFEKGDGKGKVVVTCDKCGSDKPYSLDQLNSDFIEELQEYRNPVFECECGRVEAVNINLPTFDEEPLADDLTIQEKTQRENVNKLIMMIREDYTR